MSHKIWLIIGMSIVTYIPRTLPVFIVSKMKLNKKLETLLTYIPYAALGALILPSGLHGTPSMPIAGILGLLFVICYGWFYDHVIVSVIGSVVIALCVLYLRH